MEIAKYNSIYKNAYQWSDQLIQGFRNNSLDNQDSAVKHDWVELRSIKQLSEAESSELYTRFLSGEQGRKGIATGGRNYLFYATTDLMKDYYSGEIDKDSVKTKINEYMKQFAGPSLGKDDHASKVKITSVMSDLYEYFSRANTRQAVLKNQETAREFWCNHGVKDRGFGANSSLAGTVYYDSEFYEMCEDMQRFIKDTLEEIANQNGVSPVDYETVEKNTMFSVDGGITYNGVWNFQQYQSNFFWLDREAKHDIVDHDFVPPKDFLYAYTNELNPENAKSLLDYIKDHSSNNEEGTEREVKKNHVLMELRYGEHFSKNKLASYDPKINELNNRFMKASKMNHLNYFLLLSY